MTESASDYKQVPSESITIEPWVTGLLFGIFLLAGIGALIYKLLQETVTVSYSAKEKTNKTKSETATTGESQGFAEYQKSNAAKQTNPPATASAAPAQSVSIPMQKLPVQQQAAQSSEPAAPAHPAQHKVTLAPAESIHYYDEKQFHDEEDSMAEYGYYGENGQFNEDGSFIGLYGQDRFQAVQDRIAAYAAQTQAQLKQLNSAPSS